MEIVGFLRPDGQVGIRNKVAIIYTVHCSMVVAQRLQSLFPQHTQLFGYPGGCAMREAPVSKIVALGKHSQYGAALVVGLGCEGTEAHMIAEAHRDLAASRWKRSRSTRPAATCAPSKRARACYCASSSTPRWPSAPPFPPLT